MATQIVFVYGTLRKGQYNRRVMAPYVVRELGEGRIRGAMYDLGAYPAIDLNDTGEIVGEWVEVTDDGLSRLDVLEGYPDYYDRTIVQDVDKQVEGWVYHMTGWTPARSKRIESGDWVLSRTET